MDKKELTIRYATPKDSDGILKVYEPYIRNTTITYEYEVPTKKEFYNRTCEILSNFPYLVCEDEGEIIGYAYGSKHRERAAFQWGVEISVYVRQEYQGKGVATELYHRILKLLKQQGFYKVYAIIDSPNEKSEKFHEKFGFQRIAYLPKVAYKLGRWCDITYYEKELRDGYDVPVPIRPFNREIREE